MTFEYDAWTPPPSEVIVKIRGHWWGFTGYVELHDVIHYTSGGPPWTFYAFTLKGLVKKMKAKHADVAEYLEGL